jgi:hypothetical protein
MISDLKLMLCRLPEWTSDSHDLHPLDDLSTVVKRRVEKSE